jgi:hypothetical protein
MYYLQIRIILFLSVLAGQIRNVYSRSTRITGGLESQFLSTGVEGILAAKLARFAETSMLSVVITLANAYRTLCRNQNLRYLVICLDVCISTSVYVIVNLVNYP